LSISFHYSTFLSLVFSKSFHYSEKSKMNSEKIWKIQKKIVKRFGKYRRK
jgi:hypothetical protein